MIRDLRGYRNLTDREIDLLIDNDCTAEDWWAIRVKEEFDPGQIRKCNFSGQVFIGKNVTIYYIREEIRNYIIEDDVVIRFSESLVTEGESAFGNGTTVNVLNETGGRAIRIYDRMTAQTAYVAAMYRHDAKATGHLNRLIADYTEKIRSSLGTIGRGTLITNCGMIRNVNTGPCAVLTGVDELVDGTVNSTPEAPSRVGRGVIARNFIMADSAEINDKSLVEHCFIGQGCRIGKGFSAEHSVFFANCEMLHGEACSVFAGPYSVSHHKSTLLIGGMFSFYNAGSNSNQSNHMYRTGPVHQGVLERGSKTTSGSYLLFPARIGPFTLVKGKHESHPDLMYFPFSYLIDENGTSILVPGANLSKSGVARDAIKWPERDARRGEKTDIICFDLLNPMTVGRIWNGIKLLETLPREPDGSLRYGNVLVPAGAIDKAISGYRQAIGRYLGEKLTNRLYGTSWNHPEELTDCLRSEIDFDPDGWVDLSGMIAPKEEIARWMEELASGRWDEEGEAVKKLEELNSLYSFYEWRFVNGLAEQMEGKSLFGMSVSEIKTMLTDYSENLIRWEQNVIADAMKDFSEEMRVGYGIDECETERKRRDFEAVRGVAEELPFIAELRRRSGSFLEKTRNLIARLGEW